MAQRGGITVEIEKALKGMDYPANKQELVQKAKENNASQEVIQTIEGLKGNNFNSSREVQEAFGQER